METSAASYAWVNLDSTKLIKLDASTKVEIRKSGKKLEILLKSGSIYGDVSKPLEDGESLDIRTSTAIVGIRGTKFSVGLTNDIVGTAAQGVVPLVQVYEGAVTVTTLQDASEETPAVGKPVTEFSAEVIVVSAGTQVIVDSIAELTPVFLESPLEKEDISGYVAAELVKAPETLENLDIALTPEEAQKQLEQDQADASRKQAEADAGRTGLETTASPDGVWGKDAGTTQTEPGETAPRPDPNPGPEQQPTVTLTLPGAKLADVTAALEREPVERVVLTGTGTLTVDAPLDVPSGKTLVLESAADVEVSSGGSVAVAGTLNAGGDFINNGSITVTSGNTFTVAGRFINNGTERPGGLSPPWAPSTTARCPSAATGRLPPGPPPGPSSAPPGLYCT